MGNVSTIVVTLSPVVTDVKITGTIDAYGSVGVYGGQTFDAALFGPAGADFTVRNHGVIESAGTSALGAGILLGSPGTILNDGGIRAGTGIEMLGGAGGLVSNQSEIEATLGNGVYLQGAGTVENTGLVKAAQTGIELAGGGYGYNRGTIFGAIGIAAGGGAGSYVYNRGGVTATSGAGISLDADGAISNAGKVNAAGDGLVLNGGGLAYNFGTIRAGGVGVWAAGGGVYNYKTGRIAGAGYGVSIGAGGYVYNAGTMIGKAAGSFSAGVAFADGGYLYNAAGGTLTGGAGVVGHDAALTVVNAGLIRGTGSFAAVMLMAGGMVTNSGEIQAASFQSSLDSAILVTGGAGTVSNGGDIVGRFYGPAIDLTGGGTVMNAGSIFNLSGNGILFGGPGTLNNSGFIEGDVSFSAGGTVYNDGTIYSDVMLRGGGSVTNNGQLADVTLYGYGIVTNSGAIEDAGIDLAAGGTVMNRGEIFGYYSGLYMKAGGYVLNQGDIGSTFLDVFAGPTGTVVNDGSLLARRGLFGDESDGIESTGASIVNNGFIDGYSYGIKMTHGGTVFQNGTVEAQSFNAVAVYFKPGYESRLVVSPGAVFIGKVEGGGGQLELASGAVAGTVSLGAQGFSGFAGITVDSGAAWMFAGGDSIAGTITLENDGTILPSGRNGLTISGGLTGNGTVDLGAGGLTLDGAVAAGQRIDFNGLGEILRIGDAADFAGTVQNFAPGETIELTGVAKNLVDGVSFGHGVLTVSEAFSSYTITFSNPASFAGEKFAVFRDHGETGITLVSTAKMAFLSAAPPTEGRKTLPALESHYSGTTAMAAPPGAATSYVAATAGWLSHDLFKREAAGFALVTIHL